MLHVTERAAHKAAQLAQKEGKQPVLRIGVRAGGCTGFNYFYEFDTEAAKENDIVLQVGELTIHIDSKSADILSETQFDYETNLLKGGFKFHNNKATQTCGCGESFSIF